MSITGNAITHSTMAAPALLVDFPSPGSKDHEARASLLGRQWPSMWLMGRKFFGPMSLATILGYSYSAWQAMNGGLRGDWRFYAFASACSVSNVLHTVFNMRGMDENINNLSRQSSGKAGEKSHAVHSVRLWIAGNNFRILLPLIAGIAGISQCALG
jgi:hypothetical protein